MFTCYYTAPRPLFQTARCGFGIRPDFDILTALLLPVNPDTSFCCCLPGFRTRLHDGKLSIRPVFAGLGRPDAERREDGGV